MMILPWSLHEKERRNEEKEKEAGGDGDGDEGGLSVDEVVLKVLPYLGSDLVAILRGG